MQPPRDPPLTVIMISYNTRELTLAALRTLFETTRTTPIHVVVLDNASSDGSDDAVAKTFGASDRPSRITSVGAGDTPPTIGRVKHIAFDYHFD